MQLPAAYFKSIDFFFGFFITIFLFKMAANLASQKYFNPRQALLKKFLSYDCTSVEIHQQVEPQSPRKTHTQTETR